MDKAKVIEAAAKLVGKGAYDKAIKEYQRVLEVDPKDVRVLQKMGELYQKKNENGEAAKYFIKVAESYSQDGFFLKAVALYKQVLKLSPDLVEVNLNLAELHQQLGLMSEATAYFQLVANAYEKQGNTKASLETLKRMVDLDPENVSSRAKLAELFARDGMTKEAIAEFQTVAEAFKSQGRQDDYLRIAERLSSLDASNLSLARELSKEYLARGDQKRALARLQVLFKADPRDVNTLSMLAEAFSGLGQNSKTLSVYKELAKIHADNGRKADEEQIWKKVEKLDPSDPDLRARSGAPPRGAPGAAPSRGATAAPASQAAPGPSGGSATGSIRKDQLSKLLTETDVYVKYGLHDKALEHLRRIFEVEPENLEAHEKAYQIYVAAKQGAQAGEQLLNVLRLCARRGDKARGQPYLDTLLAQNPRHPELPSFLSVLRPSGGAAAQPAEDVDDGAILVDTSEEEVVVSDAPEDALAHASLPVELEEAAEVVDIADEPLVAEEVPLEVEPVEAEDPALALAAEPVHEALEIEEPDVPTGQNELPSLEEPAPDTYPTDPESEVLVAAPEAESFAAAPEEELVTEDPAGEEAAAFDAAAESDSSEQTVVEDEEPVVAPDDEDDPVAGELEEASFFIDQGLMDEAREILETVMIARPGHPRAQELLDRVEAMSQAGGAEAVEPAHEAEPPPAVASVEPERDAFDLASELADELGETGETAAAAAPASGTDDFQYSVEEVFTEFKKGLEKVVKPEDVDTHYDLGIAYKEMGLVDDAIGEFQVARKGCVGKPKEIDCLTMTAMLQGMKGDWGGAVESLRQALGSQLATGDMVKALSFELGAAYEQAGEPGKALYHLQRVAKLDAAYRDVEGMVGRLATSTQPIEDPVGPGAPAPAMAARAAAGAQKARKVGYL
jgi:tetratricopeptide (TPR) repeat protein